VKSEFRFTLEGPSEADVARLLEAQRARLARRMRDGTARVTRENVLDPLRAQVKGALKSRKLPTAWRSRVYPTDATQDSLSPAGFVWSQAPQIMLAFDKGATIRPVNGARYLWIPTENVAVGRGGRRDDPKTTERKVGKFSFAPSKGGNVVAFARVVRRAGGQRRGPKFGKAPKGKKAAKPVEQIVFYVLVKQVTLRKRLDIGGVAERARPAFVSAIQEATSGQ